mgnify:CR=1 FL=1
MYCWLLWHDQPKGARAFRDTFRVVRVVAKNIELWFAAINTARKSHGWHIHAVAAAKEL